MLEKGIAMRKVKSTITPLETRGTRVPNHFAYLSEVFVNPPNQPVVVLAGLVITSAFQVVMIVR